MSDMNKADTVTTASGFSESSPFKGKTGLKRVIMATFYSAKGLTAAWKGEAAFRQELALAMVLIPLAFYLTVDGVERAVMTGSVLFVLIVELLNSAIEAIVDRVGTEHHTLSGRAKDMGSAAVLIALFLMVSTWACILL